MRNVQVIILAAGAGTRMKSALPKVLHPICGQPMVSYAVELAATLGVKQPIVVLGQDHEAVQAVLPKEVKVVIQAKPLGTADAVLMAKPAVAVTGTILILYADTPLLRRTTLHRLVESHAKSGATCTLLTAHLADPSGYGRVTRNETGQVSGVVEETDATVAERAIREINVGPLVCQGHVLFDALAAVQPTPTKGERYLTSVIAHIARQTGATIQTSSVEEVVEAFGINARTDLARAIGVIRQRILTIHLHNGVTIEDPTTTFIDRGVTIGSDTTIHPCTRIEAGVAIGRHCSIGPFARLRSGVTIADGTRVGNFVELVRSKVGPRVCINHFSYLGDAVVDEETNIGAGTVTANYDGTSKHQTHIGKGAFIGSDTVLIAPVKVGAGALTGAGSVVTKSHDVPAKGVVVGVPAHPLDHRTTAKTATTGDHAASSKAAHWPGQRAIPTGRPAGGKRSTVTPARGIPTKRTMGRTHPPRRGESRSTPARHTGPPQRKQGPARSSTSRRARAQGSPLRSRNVSSAKQGTRRPVRLTRGQRR